MAKIISTVLFKGMITPSQCRAARGLIKWSQQQLAEAAGVGIVTIRQFENDQAAPRSATMQVIERALYEQGVTFLAQGEPATGPGVVLRSAP